MLFKAGDVCELSSMRNASGEHPSVTLRSEADAGWLCEWTCNGKLIVRRIPEHELASSIGPVVFPDCFAETGFAEQKR